MTPVKAYASRGAGVETGADSCDAGLTKGVERTIGVGGNDASSLSSATGNSDTDAVVALRDFASRGTFILGKN